MSTIARPVKTGGNTTYTAEVAAGFTKIKATEVDADFSTIYTDYNGNITNANVSPSAAISYTKLFLTGQIVNADVATNAAIVGTKLAVGAAILGQVTVAVTNNLNISGAGTEVALGTLPSITTRGGRIHTTGTAGLHIAPSAAGDQPLTIRVKRDGVTKQTIIYHWEATGITSMPFPLGISFWEQPGAGSYVYSVTAAWTNASMFLRSDAGAGNCGSFFATEYA